eukprot:7051127-Prymnesium_polylepis.1
MTGTPSPNRRVLMKTGKHQPSCGSSASHRANPRRSGCSGVCSVEKKRARKPMTIANVSSVLTRGASDGGAANTSMPAISGGRAQADR